MRPTPTLTLTLVLALMMVMAGCVSPSSVAVVSPPPTPTSVEGTALSFETMVQGEFSAYPGSEPGLFLTTNLDDTQIVIEYLGPSSYQQTLLEQLQLFQYSQHMILALFRGSHASGGYEVKIDRVIRRDNELFVYAGLCSPEGRGVIPAATNYFQIVKVPWSNGVTVDIQTVFIAYPISC